MPDALALITKYRSKGVLLDANLMVLILVGTVNKVRILNFKRTQNFTVEDFELLSHLVAYFGRLVTTPHLLSQASDLADLKERELIEVRKLFRFLLISGSNSPCNDAD